VDAKKRTVLFYACYRDCPLAIGFIAKHPRFKLLLQKDVFDYTAMDWCWEWGFQGGKYIHMIVIQGPRSGDFRVIFHDLCNTLQQDSTPNNMQYAILKLPPPPCSSN